MARGKEYCAGIPEVDRIAPRMTKEHHFDLTSFAVFLQNAEWQKTLNNIVKEHLWGVSLEGVRKNPPF